MDRKWGMCQRFNETIEHLITGRPAATKEGRIKDRYDRQFDICEIQRVEREKWYIQCEQDRQYTYNVTLRRVRLIIVAVEK